MLHWNEKNKNTPENIILIDKPKGVSSFDVIRILRKKFGVRKMGHGGTLDPLASGLMIVGIGDGTKKLTEFIKLPKVYEVEILLGKKTATGDLEGEILEEKKISDFDAENTKRVLEEMVGKLTLPVPAYSAVKVGGQPLYKKACRGEKMELPKKEMEIFWIKFKDCFPEDDYYVLKLEMEVASGSYVRSIAEEIGRRLGFPATVKELRRTEIGDFRIDEAEKLE
ncbi:tRNA pseudouridine(55) synthase TruB [Candidatus Wolfebacteria bacterium]|nr:tRNA pseudouridine(55) synthase TruB [Candidatus Wolfebacteria bacterium]